MRFGSREKDFAGKIVVVRKTLPGIGSCEKQFTRRIICREKDFNYQGDR